MSSEREYQAINEPYCKNYLSRHGWPSGLQDTLIKSFQLFPVRFFIVDDSGSMSTSDGHRLVQSADGKNK